MFMFCLCVYDIDDIYKDELKEFIEVFKIIMDDCKLK